jgi:hypothetical protein
MYSAKSWKRERRIISKAEAPSPSTEPIPALLSRILRVPTNIFMKKSIVPEAIGKPHQGNAV